MRTFFLLFLALFITPVFSEEIVINLSAESTLEPLYLELTESTPNSLGPNYLSKLNTVFAFDFNHNGKTKVITKNKSGIYSVKGTLSQKTLSLQFSNKEGNSKKLEGVLLSGNLAEDRRKVHKLSDAIFESFFHEKGIASLKILYTIRQKNGEDSSKWKSEVWESDYDGENAHPRTAEKTLCVSPIYLPKNNNSFLYVTYKTGQSKIYCALGQEKKKVSQIRGNQFMPALSPKGDLLAFVSDATGNPEIFIQRFNTEEKPWQITHAPQGAQASPTFSPDGKKIAFVSNKDGTARIYSLDLPHSPKVLSKPTILTKIYKDNTSPAWSPDGKKIAYCALTKGTRQIFLYEVATKKEIQLTSGGGHKENPTWAPNSQHLMYDVTERDSSELCLLSIQQKESTRISKGSGEKRFPSWQH